jgi:hypothetical protein
MIFRRRDDVPGFAAIQADGLDMFDQARFAQRQHRFGRLHVLEQGLRRLVDALVGGLGRQRYRHHQGIGIDIVEFGLGFGIQLLQPREKRFGFSGAEFLHRPRTSVIAYRPGFLP